LWQKISALIEQNHAFVLTSHVNPDCDALGSELALAEHLYNLDKQVTIINSDTVPAAYRFLDPQRKIKRFSQAKHLALIQQAEVIIVLDASGGWSRVGRAGEVFKQAGAIKICIDHHPEATDFVDVALIDPEAAATGELIYSLVSAMNGALSHFMAQALYAAIMTDTGSFRFPKTGPQTHRITAELLAAGVDPLYIYRQLYEQYSLARVRLKGHVLASIQTTAQGQVAYYQLDRETLKAYQVEISDLDGFAGLGQEVGGVRIVIFCLESSKSRVKISLRSDGTIPINQIAAEYDGGGHPSAAGATVTGRSLAEVTAEVVEKAKKLLENEKNASNHP
jgi:nanoRNase/pAp phosphatase (c-di-AMP/oligoRNAs hydrolase)